MSLPIQIIIGLFTLLSLVGGFVFWHFKTINSFKDDIHQLQMKMKDLEHRDELQQQTIDQLNKLYPIFEEFFKNINKGNK